MPRPLLLGEVASSEAKMTERLYGGKAFRKIKILYEIEGQ
jgi:hypothetical protein